MAQKRLPDDKRLEKGIDERSNARGGGKDQQQAEQQQK